MKTVTKKRQMPGQCAFCKSAFDKAAMTNHLKSCEKRAQAPVRDKDRRTVPLFHLGVEGRDLPQFWIHLEVPGDSTLRELDEFLRGIWLECCGHMSCFTIVENRYGMSDDAELGEKSMHEATVEDVLEPGLNFRYEYDYGSTTELALRVLSVHEGEAAGDSPVLLARNLPPEIPCSSCGKPATGVCTECMWEGTGWLCGKCARKHPCGDEMMLPVVNSPRVGVCAYTGEAG